MDCLPLALGITWMLNTVTEYMDGDLWSTFFIYRNNKHLSGFTGASRHNIKHSVMFNHF